MWITEIREDFQGRWDLKGELTLSSLLLLVELLHEPTCSKIEFLFYAIILRLFINSH